MYKKGLPTKMNVVNFVLNINRRTLQNTSQQETYKSRSALATINQTETKTHEYLNPLPSLYNNKTQIPTKTNTTTEQTKLPPLNPNQPQTNTTKTQAQMKKSISAQPSQLFNSKTPWARF